MNFSFSNLLPQRSLISTWWLSCAFRDHRAGLQHSSVSTSSHACRHYFHSRTWACRSRLHISGSGERHCINFLWSVTCQISLGCFKHVTLKFSPLLPFNKSCLFTRDDKIRSCVLHLLRLHKKKQRIFDPYLWSSTLINISWSCSLVAVAWKISVLICVDWKEIDMHFKVMCVPVSWGIFACFFLWCIDCI